MNHTTILATSIVIALAIMMIPVGGSIMQEHYASAFVGITPGGANPHNTSLQQNGDTTDKDSYTGVGLNNQETLQGEHNFNNQQYRSHFTCICIF